MLCAAQAARAAQLRLLEPVVNIDSGTGDAEGGHKFAAVLSAQLSALGIRVVTVPAERPGLADNTVASLEGSGQGRILMIGHIDTVFEAGTAPVHRARSQSSQDRPSP